MANDGSLRALVVDDETSLAELVSMGLRMAGWSVTTANDGATAVSAARNFRPDVLVLDVADTGPGISKDERSAIFDAFYSGRAPIAGHLKGTGIGLSVVSEFVQAHGGSIEIVDEKFPGAHFRLRLPLAPSLEAEPA